MKIVEVVWTPDTSEETIQAIETLSEKLSKMHVRVKDVPGDMAHVGYACCLPPRKKPARSWSRGYAPPEGVISS